jgi:hypothetical protein
MILALATPTLISAAAHRGLIMVEAFLQKGESTLPDKKSEQKEEPFL